MNLMNRYKYANCMNLFYHYHVVCVRAVYVVQTIQHGSRPGHEILPCRVHAHIILNKIC